MLVSDSTAFEDSRTALRCAIWQRNGQQVDGRDWIDMTPDAAPPGGLGCSAQAWTATLRRAAEILRSWQYEIGSPTLQSGRAVLKKPLNRSVRILFESIVRYRPIGVAATCDSGVAS